MVSIGERTWVIEKLITFIDKTRYNSGIKVQYSM